ncbi:MAG: dTDP-glucose 4,6-dehydratase [Acidimicrobiia bacterium]
MRIFVAGASGVIGLRLVPRLVAAGHDVAAMTRSPAKVDVLASTGARPIVCDVFDEERLLEVVGSFGPAIVIHQLTDLPDDSARIPEHLDGLVRIRTDGTDNLIDAARAAGATTVIAQSVAWDLPGRGAEAVAHLEDAVLAVEGVVLRYGRFYGPGTYYPFSELPPMPRITVDHAADRTVEMLDAASGVYTIAEH